MKKFRVLLLFPNGKLMNPPPISIGLFTALLKKNCFEVDLFDTTLYPDPLNIGSDEAKEESLQAWPFDFGERGVKLKESSMEEDLLKKLEEYRPDLIALSVLECSYLISQSMLKVAENFNIPVMVGGVFPTSAPEIFFRNKNVTMVCAGEGEDTLIEVCKRMALGEDYSKVENLVFKKNGKLVKNRLKNVIDINSLPIPDYSLFEKERFFRPMAGKVYRIIPIETNRGCPFLCTFCNSPLTEKLYKENSSGRFFRKKNLSVFQKELKYLIEKWDAEYIYFTSDTFLSMTDAEFDQFAEIYKEFQVPFWVQSRTETITEYRMAKLKEIGCHRMSIGVEHGNEGFRKKVLNKKFNNADVIKASKIIGDAGIPLTINNIIGFPDETRELVFDTIDLNRKLTFDTSNAVAFSPFYGTPLRILCLEKGYIKPDFISGSLNVDLPLDMPQLSREEIKGLKRTFALYARMPLKYWHQIERAEKFDEEGDRIFAELKKIYNETYFNVQALEQQAFIKQI